MNMPYDGDNSPVAEISSAPESASVEAAFPSDHAGRRLKVLVLDEEIPFPLNSGKRIRTWNLLRNLSRRHDITFLCYGTPENPGLSKFEELGIRVVLVPGLPASNTLRFYAGAFANIFSLWPYSVSRHHTRRFIRAIRTLIASQPFDLVHCEWTPYASYINAVGQLPILIMAHNIEVTVWRRRAQHASNPAERLFMRWQAWKMARFEKKCFARAGHVAVVTEEERQTAKQWGAPAVYLVSNGVDTEYLHSGGEAFEPDSLLFLGSLDWQPNRDALLYLLSEILPRIQAANPQAKLRIVGRQPATKLREQVEDLSGVEWVGEVPDIRPHFARAAIVLVPLRIGGGSRIKILESLSMGKAVVATHIGAEGLDVVPGVHCLIADSPADFSQSVTQLLADPERAVELGRNGRELVVRQYDWGGVAKILEQAWIDTASAVKK
ncbi:MAG: glycosyltransferase family 4 protein, partial [Acidobacteriaceae bacterium]